MSKRKGSFTNNPPKPTPDNTPPVIRKSSLHSTEQDFDPMNDQQWHMVSSNKSQRKGTVSRRETPDESQTTNKTPKVSSADSGNYVFFVCVMHGFVLKFSFSSSSTFVLSCFCIDLFYRKTNDTNVIITHI